MIMGITVDNMWMNLAECGWEADSMGGDRLCQNKFQEMEKNA